MCLRVGSLFLVASTDYVRVLVSHDSFKFLTFCALDMDVYVSCHSKAEFYFRFLEASMCISVPYVQFI